MRTKILSTLLLLSSIAYSQIPINDACTGAIDIGTLPAADPCSDGVGGTASGNLTINGTNVNATAETPYSTIVGCYTGNDMASPSADVWYSFVASSYTVQIDIAGLANPNVGLYQGADCDNIAPWGCGEGTGNQMFTFEQITLGQTYYLQISGGDLTDQAAFSFNIENYQDCNDCIVESQMVISPLPTNGVYQPNTTVNFCYTINGYIQQNTNWLHGVEPIFGPGWDVGTLVPGTPPENACNLLGEWGWYSSITGTATGNTAGAGFYFDEDFDGNPGNGFGDGGSDDCSEAATWIFCWDVTTVGCSPGDNNVDLSIEVLNYGDGEIGAWSSVGCSNDPPFNLNAVISCCNTPIVVTINETCGGSCDGSSTVTGDGVSPYDYVWTNTADNSNVLTETDVAGSSTALGLCPGNYLVSVTDDNGCEQVVGVTITGPTPLTQTNTTVSASCGSTDGSLTITASGGTGTLVYSVDGGTTTQASGSFPGLGAGNYNILVEDASGCQVTEIVTITADSGPSIDNLASTDVSCFNASDGTITITASGGNGTIEYSIDNGATFQINGVFTGLPGNTYDLVVQDVSGCQVTTQVNITESTQVTFTTSTTDPDCGVNNGSVVITAAGGEGGYTYSIDNGANFQASNTFNTLGSGNYDIVVQDLAGCFASGTASLNNSAAPTIDNINFTNITCNGSSDGTIIISASGGVGVISYSIDNGANFQVSGSFTGLSANTYNIVIEDINGCQASSSVTISEPDAIVVTTTTINLTCFESADGEISISAVGGNNVFNYSIDNGAIFNLNADYTGLAINTYNIVVEDASGCQGTDQVTLAQPTPIALAIAGFDASCNGLCDGEAIVIPSGGTVASTYTYLWDDVNNSTTPSLNDLCVRTYIVTVTDDNGCFEVGQVTVDEPIAIVIDTATTISNCGQPDGSISTTVSGGVPAYTYAWSVAGSNLSETTPNLTDLIPETYTLIVTDNNLCTETIDIPVGNTPGPIADINSSSNTLCFGSCDGTATVSVTGGSGVYFYDWISLPSGTSIGQNNTNAIDLCPGLYGAVITDDVGCISLDTISIFEPDQLILNSSNDTTICLGNCIDISASSTGGTGAISYQWIYDVNVFLNGSNQNVCPGASTQYDVTGTDVNGCSAAEQVIITLNPPITVQVTALGPTAICPGDEVTINAIAAGGNGGPFDYTWMPDYIIPDPTITDSPSTETTYIVTAADGCGSPTSSDSITVTIHPMPSIDIAANQEGCAPHMVNFIDNIDPTPISYTWDFGNPDNSVISNSDSPSHTYNTPGSYDVNISVLTAEGCLDSATFPSFITVYDHPIADFFADEESVSIFRPEICFTDNSIDAVAWDWDFAIGSDSSDLSMPCYAAQDTGCYNVQLIVENQYTCLDTTSQTFCVESEFIIYIPNAFTPDADEINDTFFPSGFGIDLDNYEFWIFDRWGNMIFNTRNFDEAWDGVVRNNLIGLSNNIAQMDVYVWKIKLKDFEGNPHEYVGHVSLIR